MDTKEFLWEGFLFILIGILFSMFFYLKYLSPHSISPDNIIKIVEEHPSLK